MAERHDICQVESRFVLILVLEQRHLLIVWSLLTAGGQSGKSISSVWCAAAASVVGGEGCGMVSEPKAEGELVYLLDR